jgi:branched-chain amino acid transport system ATP-binding protein
VSAPQQTPSLQLEHISLSFGGVQAVTDVSFQVRRHELCALIGPNGAGKSSLLNVVSGIYRPQAGRIVLDGQAHAAMTPRTAARSGIARTFQNLGIFRGMSVLENLIMGHSVHVRSSWLEQILHVGRGRADEHAARERAEQVLEYLDIQAHRHTRAGLLPYGLQKRVELGRAIVSQPQLLLLDEPMAGMNSTEKTDLSGFILGLNRRFGTTILLIEHDMRVVMDISDRVVVLDYGRVVGDGTPDQVRSNPEVVRAYLGTKRDASGRERAA